MRFTIRDLLWLTLLAAVLVAWWVDRGRLERLVQSQANDIARLNRAVPMIPLTSPAGTKGPHIIPIAGD